MTVGLPSLLAACGGGVSPTAPSSGASTSASASPKGAASSASPSAAASAASASGSAKPSAAAGAFPVPPLSPRGKLNIGLPEGNTDYIAFYYALDKGYFERAGLDITPQHFRGSVVPQMPRLATGELDFLPVPPSPALFNQEQQGFGVKAVAGMDKTTPGHEVHGWLMVAPDQKDKIKDYKDLKGKTIEAASPGTPIDLVAHEAIKRGGLTAGKDVKLIYSVKNPATDFLAVMKNRKADAAVVLSPFWVPLEKQGVAVKFKSFDEIAPWYQTNALGFSSKAVQNNRAAVVKFLEVFLFVGREVNKSNGQWTDDLVQSAVKWSFGADTPDGVRGAGDVQTYEPNGTLNLDSLHRAEDLWLQEGLVKQKVDDSKLIDTSPLDDALKNVGKS